MRPGPAGLRRRTLLGLPWLTALGAGAGACSVAPPPNRVPLDMLHAKGPCVGPAPELLVMLPGIRSAPREFVDEGFVAALRAHGRTADIVIADAHAGYYSDRSVLERLRQDIVLPARAEGYRQIWLVGISLGGLGALGYGVRHGSEIDGVVVLAPFLGPPALLAEIAGDGGPRTWLAQAHARNDDDLEREVWEWLAKPEPMPPVYLGFGREDRFVEGQRLLASALPAERRFDTPGGHNWSTWRTLWSRWLDRGLLTATCGLALGKTSAPRPSRAAPTGA